MEFQTIFCLIILQILTVNLELRDSTTITDSTTTSTDSRLTSTTESIDSTSSTATTPGYTGCDDLLNSNDTKANINTCILSLYAFNIHSVLSYEQRCWYYSHVLKCIKIVSNTPCDVQELHTVIPEYLRNQSVPNNGFENCSVSEPEDNFCSDSSAILIRGLSVCGSLSNVNKHHCDYMESVFLKQCYITYGQAEYFNCTENQIRNGVYDQMDWFQKIWNFNLSTCETGEFDICKNSLALKYIDVNKCYGFAYHFARSGIMTDEDKCRRYLHFLQCMQTEVKDDHSQYKCSLTSLHIWVPDYFKGLGWNNVRYFDASPCNVSTTIEFCNDSRALFLYGVDYCRNMRTYELFSCGHIKYIYETCMTRYQYTQYIQCNAEQREAALLSEAAWFNSTFNIDVYKCFEDGIYNGSIICNNGTSNRNVNYNAFYNCFSVSVYSGYYNRSRLLNSEGACQVYKYLLVCVNNSLGSSGVNGCQLPAIHAWFVEEIYTGSVLNNFLRTCTVEEDHSGTFCDDSFALFSHSIGFCYYAFHISNTVENPPAACHYFNKALQYCYYWRSGSYLPYCGYSKTRSAFIDHSDWIRAKTNITITDCFEGCKSSDTCCSRYYGYNNHYCTASSNNSQCSCSYDCHSRAIGTCCYDFYESCVCNSNLWSFIEERGCNNLLTNHNRSAIMTLSDGCRNYQHYLVCIQKESMCSIDFLKNKSEAYIHSNYREEYNFNYTLCNDTDTFLEDFCNDDKALFFAGVNKCPTPDSNEFFKCGYFRRMVDSCYSWSYSTSYISCSSAQIEKALLLHSDWFTAFTDVSVSDCTDDSVNICGYSRHRRSIYTHILNCFNGFQNWFNKSGFIDLKGGCRYYAHAINCARSLENNPYYGLYLCTIELIHEWFLREVYEQTAIYELVKTCNISETTKDMLPYCDDNEAKFTSLFGVFPSQVSLLSTAAKSVNGSVCPYLSSILNYNVNLYQQSYFRCSFAQLEATMYNKSNILQEYLGETVEECYPSSINDTVIPTSVLEPGDIYPYGRQVGDSFFTGDERISSTISISIGLPTRNRFFNNLNIGSNGLISFSILRNFNPPNPMEFIKVAGINFIAPFWTDIDFRDYYSGIYYQVYDGTITGFLGSNVYRVLQTATRDVRYFYNDKTFEAEWVFVVTWDKVSPSRYSSKDEEISFQCVLVTDGTNSYVVFKYISMNWPQVKGRKAAIGYRLHESKENDLSFNDAAFSIDKFKGNVGLNGFYIYKLTDDNVEGINYQKLCFKWYSKYQGTYSKAGTVVYNPRYNCPCSLRSIPFDWRWLRIQTPIAGVACYSLFASKVLPSTRTCCYNIFFGTFIRIEPSAGTFNYFHPIFAARSHITEELLPKQYCCYKTNLCHLFYSLRPIGTCYGRPPFTFRWFWGDPHIETLDGLQYTFNGFGEYELLKFENENITFELQARTDLIMNENGSFSNATIFSAFAAKDGDTRFQVELSSDRKQLVVFANGIDYSGRFNTDSNFGIIEEQIMMSRHNDTLVVVFGNSGLQLNVTMGIRMLTFSTTVPDEFSGGTVGLVGNFDGNKENDFIIPNGTVLTNNETDTEEKIFFNFGIHWAINSSSSLFNYTKGKTAADYAHPEFIPLFIDKFPDEDVSKAKDICGGQTASTACIFDFLLTKDEAIGKASGKVDDEALETVKASENKIPEISGTSKVYVTIGSPVQIHVNASDDGNFTHKVISGPEINFTFNEKDNAYIWTPQDLKPINISITVIDESGLAAPPLDVYVVVCSNCSNHGTCSYNETLPTEILQYQYAICVCDAGWTGDHCETDIDGCSGLPCSDDRNCTDLLPSEEAELGRAYNCSPCQIGYKENGQKCEDLNECNDTSVCHQICENTMGSFICRCFEGYRISGDNTCVDIDECIEGSHGCEQRCTNNDGNFTCSCVFGYELKSDGKSCNQVLDLCAINGLTCEYACNNNTETGNYECICRNGWTLSNDKSSCEDIDECKLGICPQKCQNANGTFACSCHDGYYLDTDGVSCKRCERRYWGPNCANQCQCGIGEESCDPSKGCICLPGYEGEQCNEDIDECSTNPGTCSGNETCENTFGSYICHCLQGFTKSNDVCKNINECESEILNNCSVSVSTCEDNEGSFTCRCKEGYNQNGPYECIDIDECISGSHSCEQLCSNVDGSYNCDCELGFVLNNDRKTCRKDFEACVNISCAYGCKFESGLPVCFCKDGFQLDQDGRTCIDLDECANNTHKCSYSPGCSNINGSYVCICQDGWYIENDGRTCTECDIFHWGPNCVNLCNCGRGSSHCNNTKGCQCVTGWSGDTCSEDIDECDNNPCIDQNEKCINTPGSYVCLCKDGYENRTGICENIDECETNRHRCDQICLDIDGSYNCSCNTGFQLLDSSRCEDIDECKSEEKKCDQKCDNTIGSYRCSCQEGFILNSTTRHDCFPDHVETTTDNDKTVTEAQSSVSTESTSTSVPMHSSASETISYRTTTDQQTTTTLVSLTESTSTDSKTETTERSTDSTSTDLSTQITERSTDSTSTDSTTETTERGTDSNSTDSKTETTERSTESTSTDLSTTQTTERSTESTAADSTTEKGTESTSTESRTETPERSTESTSTDLSTQTTERNTESTVNIESTTTSRQTTTNVDNLTSQSSLEFSTSATKTVTFSTPILGEDEKTESFSITYTLDVEVNVDLTEEYTAEYNETLEKADTALTDMYRTVFQDDFKDVIINSIRKGSLVADHTVVLKEQKQDDLTKLVIKLLKGEIKITYNNTESSVTSVSFVEAGKEKNITSANINESLCDLYTLLKPCKNSYSCEISDGSPKCIYRPSASQDYTYIAVVVTVSVFVCLLLLSIVIMIILIRKKNTKAKKNQSRSNESVDVPKKLTKHWPSSRFEGQDVRGPSYDNANYGYDYDAADERPNKSIDQYSYRNFGGRLFSGWQDRFGSDDMVDFSIRRPKINVDPSPDY